MTSPDASLFLFFLNLPGEIQIAIWEQFCPSLAAVQWICEVHLDRSESGHKHGVPDEDQEWHVKMVNPQDSIMRMLCICRQTRSMVLRRFPDLIGAGEAVSVLRFNAKTDIVLLSVNFNYDYVPVPCLRRFLVESRFGSKIAHLALDQQSIVVMLFALVSQPAMPIGDFFPAVQAIYFCMRDHLCDPGLIQWCLSDKACTVELDRRGGTVGGANQKSRTFSWPNLHQHGNWAQEIIPLEWTKEQSNTQMAAWFYQMPAFRRGSCALFPMVQFRGYNIPERLMLLEEAEATRAKPKYNEFELRDELVFQYIVIIEYLQEHEEAMLWLKRRHPELT